MSKRVTISTLDAMKASGDKFVMITAYDATFARLPVKRAPKRFWSATHSAWCCRDTKPLSPCRSMRWPTTRNASHEQGRTH